jgi:hypothetical protein
VQVATSKIDEYARGMISGSGSTLFEELGLYYIGPVDGHNVDDLVAGEGGHRGSGGRWCCVGKGSRRWWCGCIHQVVGMKAGMGSGTVCVLRGWMSQRKGVVTLLCRLDCSQEFPASTTARLVHCLTQFWMWVFLLLPAVLQEVRSADTVGPVLVHVITEKGRGYLPAETAQVGRQGCVRHPPSCGLNTRWLHNVSRQLDQDASPTVTVSCS